MQFPNRDLTDQFISLSYQDAVQRYANTSSVTYLLDGYGYVIAGIPNTSVGQTVLTQDQTASWAENAVSSSYSVTSTMSDLAVIAETASVAGFADSASFAESASHAESASWAPSTQGSSESSSWASQSLSASWAPTSQIISASWASQSLSASWAPSQPSNVAASASWASQSLSSSWAPTQQIISASWSSQSLSASWAPMPTIPSTDSASWASSSYTASYLAPDHTYEVTTSWANNATSASWSPAQPSSTAVSSSWASQSMSSSVAFGAYNSGSFIIIEHYDLLMEKDIATDGGVEQNISGKGYGYAPVMHGQFAGGTRAAPTPAVSGNLIWGIGSRPLLQSGSTLTWADHSSFALWWVALENFTTQSSGTALQFVATPQGQPYSSRSVILDLRSSGSSPRIMADWTNTNQSNRMTFQSMIGDSRTSVGCCPSGTGSNAQWNAFGTSDPSATHYVAIAANPTEVSLVAGYTGPADWTKNKPLKLYVNNTSSVCTFATSSLMYNFYPPSCIIRKTTAQNLGLATYASVSFDAAVYDNSSGSMYQSGKTDRIYAPFAGIYQANATIGFNQTNVATLDTASVRIVNFRINSSASDRYGNTALAPCPTGSLSTFLNVTTLLPLNAGDYVEVDAYQNYSSSLAILTDATVGNCRFSLRYVSG